MKASSVPAYQGVHRLGLFSVMLLYGIGGSPSPDQLGWIEVCVFFLLLLTIGFIGVTTPLMFFKTKAIHAYSLDIKSPLSWLFIFFIWGTITGTLGGLIHGHSLAWMIRDYAGFLMLCLPLFYISYLHNKIFFKDLLYVILGIGTLFSLRIIQNVHNGQGDLDTGGIGALYLSISPEILFTACFLTILCLYTVFWAPSSQAIKRRVRITVVSFLIAFITVYIFYINSMRAGIGAVILSMMFITLWALVYRPKKSLILMMGVCVGIILFQENFLNIHFSFLDNVLEKQRLVGWNQRLEELSSVYQELRSSVFINIIGLGWGAGIESPASNGMYVNFTHNMFSSLWLKTGIVGVILMSVFLICLFVQLLQTIDLKKADTVMIMCALLICLFINIFLYGGYKSLGFGLCLTLLLSLSFSEEKEQRFHPPIVEKP